MQIRIRNRSTINRLVRDCAARNILVIKSKATLSLQSQLGFLDGFQGRVTILNKKINIFSFANSNVALNIIQTWSIVKKFSVLKPTIGRKTLWRRVWIRDILHKLQDRVQSKKESPSHLRSGLHFYREAGLQPDRQQTHAHKFLKYVDELCFWFVLNGS